VKGAIPKWLDDGLLLSIVLDPASQTSFLLLLDARSMQEVTRAKTPQHITSWLMDVMITGAFQAIPYWYLMWNYWKFRTSNECRHSSKPNKI
jgi:hypothetical protein